MPTRFYLDASDRSLSRENPSSASEIVYEATGDGVTFTTAPFDEDVEVTGFVTLRLWAASSTTDMDFFATLRAFAPDGSEVIFDGAHEPTPVIRGWPRASHRALDAERTTPHRVYHSHRDIAKLTPGAFYELDIEIWPTSLIYPRGYRLAVTVAGREFEIAGVSGRILHRDPLNGDAAEVGGTHALATGAGYAAYLVLPVIPD